MDKNKVSINKQKRFLYSPKKVDQALKAINNGMSVLKASKEFRVPRTTLRNKISGKSPLDSPRHCGPESVLGKENENLLVEWVLNCAKMGFPIDREGLLHSVKKIVDDANIKTPFSNNKPGKKWFYSFLKRHSFLSQKHAEYVNKARGTVTKEKIEKWFTEVKDLLTENGKAALTESTRVFNMDETCFFLAPKGGLILGPRGQNVYNESTNSDKENVTTLFAVNANGQFAPSLTDSLDDVDINEATNQGTVDLFEIKDMKVGDYILASFRSAGKRAVLHYKYVAKILQVLEDDDFEVQCLKSLDETKTAFKLLENDQCVISKKEILGVLPDPQLVQFGRILKTVFPAAVDIYEKL